MDTKLAGAKAKAPQMAKVEKHQEKPKEETIPVEREKEKLKPVEKAKEKPKPTGTRKHDFFKPRVKETKKEETSKADVKTKTFFSVVKKEVEQKDAGTPAPAVRPLLIAD